MNQLIKNKSDIKILIIDDDELILDISQQILEIKGYQVDTSPDYETVKNKITQINPDVILLDIHLQNDVSGFKIAKLIREIPFKKLLLAVTGDTEITTPKYTNAGFNVVIKKPYQYHKLDKLIQQYNNNPQPYLETSHTITFN